MRLCVARSRYGGAKAKLAGYFQRIDDNFTTSPEDILSGLSLLKYGRNP